MNLVDNTKEHREQREQEEEYSFPYHFASRFHPSFQTGFIDYWAMNYNLTLELVIDLVSREHPSSLVDIGCGEGRLTHELNQAFPEMTVVGVDYSPQSICLANTLVPNAKFHQTDITGEHSLGKFKAAVLMEVFEHIPDAELQNFARATAELVAANGLLIVTVPHKNKPLEYKHFRHYTTQTLDAYFGPYFKSERVYFLEKTGWLNRLLNKLVANRVYVLNSPRLLNAIYQTYRNQIFRCSGEDKCSRIAVCYRRSE
ncbi:MAG: class I SAM-dependent methyltransferase [Xanthomonadales bacterium]|jgi:2-polyprenyl-3-methyl-5-hydroxy-6-metoxy-1,4-benzoquinol methylase|nr:class I SAM-dependent methyltransferase [Xanthomonadales bacterium]